MIITSDGSVFIDGLSYTTLCGIKLEDGEIPQATFCVINDDGEPVPAPLIIYVYDDIGACGLCKTSLVGNITYTIEGKCAPFGSTVYLSREPEKIGYLSLRQNVVTSTTSDTTTGIYKFEDVTNIDGNICLWTVINPADATSSSITLTAVTPTDMSEIEEETLVYKTILLSPIDSSTGTIYPYPQHTFSGTTSLKDGSTVYCKALTSTVTSSRMTSNINYAYLDPAATDQLNKNWLSSNSGGSTVTNGRFTFTMSFTTQNNNGYITYPVYAVWCLTTEDDNIAVDSIKTIGLDSPPARCLSEDTPITLSNGDTRLLKDIRVGDSVLSENNRQATVTKVANGITNPFHILYHFDNGTVIDEVGDHRFYNVNQGFWQILRKWNIGDRAIGQNGSMPALVSVERIDEPKEMFTLWTNAGSYFANGLLSGRAELNEPLLANATPEQALDMIMSLDEYHTLELLGMDGMLP